MVQQQLAGALAPLAKTWIMISQGLRPRLFFLELGSMLSTLALVLEGSMFACGHWQGRPTPYMYCGQSCAGTGLVIAPTGFLVITTPTPAADTILAAIDLLTGAHPVRSPYEPQCSGCTHLQDQNGRCLPNVTMGQEQASTQLHIHHIHHAQQALHKRKRTHVGARTHHAHA